LEKNQSCKEISGGMATINLSFAHDIRKKSPAYLTMSVKSWLSHFKPTSS